MDNDLDNNDNIRSYPNHRNLYVYLCIHPDRQEFSNPSLILFHEATDWDPFQVQEFMPYSPKNLHFRFDLKSIQWIFITVDG